MQLANARNKRKCMVMDIICRFFCATKKHAYTIHKKIVHHFSRRRHVLLPYIHIALLLVFFYLLNITSFHSADEVAVPTEDASIVIENEPQIVPDQQQESSVVVPEGTQELSASGTTAMISGGVIEEMTGETVLAGCSGNVLHCSSSLSGEEISQNLSGENAEGTGVTEMNISGENLSGGTIFSGNQIFTGSNISTGLLIQNEEYFSGVLDDLSGETLYDISGNVVGEVTVQSGDVLPIDLSGQSLIPQPLSVIYPDKTIQLDSSGYVLLDSLFSVMTTGGEIGATYCSRITYENITSILKAGIWTWRETNDFVLQGDAEQLLKEGIADDTMLEVTGAQMQMLFSGSAATVYGSVYDIYITFIKDNETVYHRVAIIYADDADTFGWYVLDPLRGTKTITPQDLSGYMRYYENKEDVHRYVGQAYDPMRIKEKIVSYKDIIQRTGDISSNVSLSGEIETGTTLSGNVLSGTEEMLSGIIADDTGNISIAVEITGNTSDEISGIALTAETPVTMGGDAAAAMIDQTGGIMQEQTQIQTTTGTEEIVEGYFDRAYDKGVYDDKIIELQKLLARLQLYTGDMDGVYSDAVIESVYAYQEQNGLLQGNGNNRAVWGYLGPKTRKSLNDSYVEYQIYENAQTQQISISSGAEYSDTGSLLVTSGNVVYAGQGDIQNISGQEMLQNIGAVSGFIESNMFDIFLDIPMLSGLDLELEKCDKKDYGCKRRTLKDMLLKKGYQLSKKGLVQLSSDSLIGSGSINMDEIDGALVMPIVMQSPDTLSGSIAEVQLPEGTIVKNADGESFTGDILPPEFIDPETIEGNISQDVVAAIDVGSDEHVQFEDISGNAIFATFRVPVPGMNIGDTIDVNYSEDGEHRNYIYSVEIQEIDGEPYAIFEANHFTTFYLGNTTGTFVINNDAAYATGLAVTLNSAVTGADYMRFGNSIAQRDASNRLIYNSSYSWTLSGDEGINWVYAQFSGNGVIRNVSDSIIYDTSSGTIASGQQCYLDGSTGGIRFIDSGPRGLIFTGYGNVKKSSRSGENVMQFDGNGDYIENTSGFITSYPFSISAWIRVGKVSGTQGIVMFGNGSTTSTYYGIQMVNSQASMVSRNTTARTLTAGPTLSVGEWVHIVGIFNSSTSRELYVNGVSVGTNTQNGGTFSTTNPQWRIGRYNSSTTNYFSGDIDEVHIYNKALTQTDIDELYIIPPTFDTLTTYTGTPTLYGEYTSKLYLSGTSLLISGYTINVISDGTGKRKTVPFTTGLSAGTYDVTLNYMNVYGKTGSMTYTSGLIINTSGANILYTPSTATTGTVISTLTGLDATYMIVNNSGSELHTFTGNGSFIYQFVDKEGTTGSIIATVNRIKSAILSYSSLAFYENSGTNNGTISGNIIVTLSTGAFSGNIVTGHYVTLSNVPSGLTGVFTLSGTNKIIISLSGNAINHTAADSTGNLSVSFLTGAFVNMNPSDVGGSLQTGIIVQFFDAPGYVSGQQLRIKGNLSGGLFYDYSPIHHLTTGVNNPVSTTMSGETVMLFNAASSQSITVGTYTLTDYTISARFNSSVANSTWRSIIGDSAGSREMSMDTSNKLQLYNNGALTSTMTIQPNTWYHAVVVKDSAGTKLYINGVLNNSNTSTTTISNLTLSIGNHPYYNQQWSGYIDEVKIYDSALSASQIENLYMLKPSFSTTTVYDSTFTLNGYVPDYQMGLSLTISGTTYPAVNNQDGTWTAANVGPLSSGTYNVQLNYTNVYEKTGSLIYTGGLIVRVNSNKPTATVAYTPPAGIYTTGNVVATLTGFNQTGITITNNSGSAIYTFTGNGSFVFTFVNGSGYTGATTATVSWIKKASLNYSSLAFYEDQIANDGSIDGNIIVSLNTGSFSGNIVTGHYVNLSNVPSGLTGNFILSGTNQLIISLSGNATNNAASNSVNNLSISFLTGAFVNMNPDDVIGSVQTGISLTFFDPNPGVGMYPSDDTTLDADNAESNGCGAGLCQEYNYGTTTYGGISDFGSKMLIRFNLSSIPAGATITSATLRLSKYYLGGGDPTDDGTGFKLRKMINNPGWIEGTKNASIAGTGEPNYKQRKWTQENRYNGDPGLVPGIDYGTTDLMDIGGFTGSATASYTQVFTLNNAGISVIQDRVYDSGSNQGFVLAEANQNRIYFRTKETTTVSERPYLVVTYISDTIAPYILSTMPVDNEHGVVLDLHPTITFSEHVAAISGKNIYIKKSVDNSVSEIINAGDASLVSVDDNFVTINPLNELQSNTGYYIQVESGAFVDRAGNPFTGILDSTTWNFTTVDTNSVPNVINPSVSGLEYTRVTLGGTITSTGSSSVNAFGVVRGTSPGFTISGANILLQTGSRDATGAFTLTIAGFNSGSTIYFRAFAANAAGTGYSQETGFTLKPTTVQLGNANMISNDTFTVNRSAVTGATHYEIYVSTGSACTSYLSGYGPILSTGVSQKINGLDRETTYYYKIFAVNSGGLSPVSNIGSATTSYLPRPRVRLKFEETGGAIAYDSSENYNYGIISGYPIMGISGADGKAYNFDGVNDFVSVTDFDMDPDLTVSFRFKTTTTGSNQHIFSYGDDTGANSINIIFDAASQSLKTYINGYQNILNVTGSLYSGLLDNQRHFYSLTIDDNDAISGKKLCTVYIDGITKLVDSSITAGSFDPTTNIFIGRRSVNNAGTFFNGDVDDVRIYGKILTSPEIYNLYATFKDTVPPTATVTYAPGSGARTSGNVIVTLTGYSEPITITNNGGSNIYVFTGNGSFTFEFRDNGFNTGSVTANVTWIDKTLPSVTLLEPASGTMLHSGTVFSRSGSDNVGISGYIFKVYDNSGTQVYTTGIMTTGIVPYTMYLNNGDGIYTWTVTAIDEVGNQGVSLPRTFVIDKATPIVTNIVTDPLFPIYNSGTLQNITFYGESDEYPVWITLGLYDGSGNVLAYTGEIEFMTSGSMTFAFPGNVLPDGVYTFYGTVRDAADNFSGKTLGTVTVDTITPTATIQYSTTGWTSGNVVATLTGLSESGVTIMNNGGSNTYTFTGNGNFTFEFVDLAGNTGSVTASVNRIDKISPTVELLTPASGTTVYSGILFSWSGSDNVAVSGYIFKVYDSSGVEEMTLSRPGTTTGIVLPLFAYGYMNNGSYTRKIVAVDNAGNTQESESWIFNVDKDVPHITNIVTEPPFPIYNSGTLQNITFYGESDEYPVWITLGLYDSSGNVLAYTGEIEFLTSGSMTFAFPGNVLPDGVYSFYGTARDNADNISGITLGYVIVDTTKPTGSITYSPETVTSGDVVVTLTGLSESGVTITNNSGLDTYTFTGNGSFIFEFVDMAGNTGSAIATVTWIDKIPPTATIQYSATGWTSGDVVAILTGLSESGVTITNNGGLDTYTFTGNGSFMFEFIDLAGNTGNATASVTGIDRIAPTIELLTPASGTVVYSGILFSWSGYDKAGISGYVFRVYDSSGIMQMALPFASTITGILLPLSSYGYMNNGDYTWTMEVQDPAGNIATTASWTFIVDKEPPVINILYTVPSLPLYNSGKDENVEVFGESSKYPVRVRLNLYNTSGVVIDTTGEQVYYQSGSFVYSFPGMTLSDGVYSLCGEIRDVGDNVTEGCLGDIIRDTIVPTGEIVYSTTGLTSGDVVVTLTGLSESGVMITNNGGLDSYTFTGNGSFTFEFIDLAGNTGSATATVTWIDKEKPTVAGMIYTPAAGTPTFGPVYATLTGISEPIILLNDGTGTTEFDDNGEFTFEFMDLAGNTGEATARVWWIKPDLGTITGAEFSTEYQSNPQYIGGYDTGAESTVVVSISNSTGVLYKNGVQLSGLTATGIRDDEFYVGLISSPDPLTTVTSTMTIESVYGVVTGDFNVITKDLPFMISAPSAFDFGLWEASELPQSIERSFTGSSAYFDIIDRQGTDTGFYTTLSISNMISENGDSIPYTDIAVKAFSGIDVLSGEYNSMVYSAITGAYQYFGASPLTFLARDTGPNGGVVGIYGLQTVRKIDIPALQNVGSYTGVITYTLY